MRKWLELFGWIDRKTLRFMAYAGVLFFLGGLAGSSLALVAYGLGGVCYGIVLGRALDLLRESSRRAGVEEGKALAYDQVIEILRVHAPAEGLCKN